MSKTVPAFAFSFFEYCIGIHSGACLLFWQRRIKKLLLIGLVACAGTNIHPAAQPSINSQQYIQDVAQGKIQITPEQFDELEQDVREQIINLFLLYCNRQDSPHDYIHKAFFQAIHDATIGEGFEWAIKPLVEKKANVNQQDTSNT